MRFPISILLTFALETKQEAVDAPVLTFVHSIITCFLTRLLELVRVALLYCDALDGLWATLVVS